MITIDISGKNRDLYDGRVGSSGGTFHIEVEGQEGVDIVTKNVRKLIADIPEDERGEVLVTGIAPRWVAVTAIAAVYPHFKVTKHYDGRELIILPPYEQPPADLPQCDEAEG